MPRLFWSSSWWWNNFKAQSCSTNKSYSIQAIYFSFSLWYFNVNVQFSLHSHWSHFIAGRHYCVSFPPNSGHFKIGWHNGFSFPSLVGLGANIYTLFYFLPRYRIQSSALSSINSSELIHFSIGKVITGFLSLSSDHNMNRMFDILMLFWQFFRHNRFECFLNSRRIS